ncbi:MAG: electron transfer flavoprotein subunit beta/FixA family protein [Syntrophomonadaceae bacterium]|jgi:electron transfer flavoprotein beta subunit|nr:electron transfer flavoprotein subunit beta/FixA family protein [Syntrophomonadaceae bacterium]MDH7497823.1 electron transfer flavoprotein subunit beta/FixA family protein [Syntrophomonadaceae bacterium]
MPDIITCFKWAVDEADIRPQASGEVALDRVGYKISEYDRNALEAAAQLKEAHGGSVTAITVATPAAKKGLKDALSRGPDRACFVNDAAFDALEPAQTAALLAGVIRDRLPFDLILCGEGSSDLYAQQVGPRLAQELGIPCVTYVNRITLEGSTLLAERKLEDGIEVVKVELPALVTVLPDINTPRIPGLKDTLEASKKPVQSVGPGEAGGEFPARLQTVALRATSMERRCVRFPADDAGIRELVEALRKSGAIG